MKFDKIANSGNDEYYTPPYAIEPLLKYLPKNVTVWCPFDTENSHFSKMIREHDCNVIATHIDNGQDFFYYEPENYDYIISNPPFSKKTAVFQKLFKLNKNFAMLISAVGLFESQVRFELFRDNDWDIMYMNRRIAFFKSYEDQTPSISPPFSSVYISKGIFPNKILFEEINKKGK